MSTAEAEVRAVVEDWAAAIRRRDIPGILRNHSPDILMFDVPPPLESRGIDAYRDTWNLFFSWAPNPAVFDIQEMRINAGADVAFVAATMRCAGARTGEHVQELEFRLTIGLHKQATGWVIVHEHHSVPAEQ